MTDNKIDEKTAEKIVESGNEPSKSNSQLWTETFRKQVNAFGGYFFQTHPQYVQPFFVFLFMLLSLVLGMQMVKRQQDLESKAVFEEEKTAPSGVYIPKSVTTCEDYCQFKGYESGVCRASFSVCNQEGMVYEPEGREYCTDSELETACCCK